MARSTNNLSTVNPLLTSIEAIEKIQPPVKRRAQMRRDTRRRHKRFATIKQRSSYLCSGCEYCQNTKRDGRRQVGFADDWSTDDPALPEPWDDELYDPEDDQHYQVQVMRVTGEAFDRLLAMLAEPPRVIPELIEVVKRPSVFVDRRKMAPKKTVVLPKHLRCPDDDERPERRAHGGR